MLEQIIFDSHLYPFFDVLYMYTIIVAEVHIWFGRIKKFFSVRIYHVGRKINGNEGDICFYLNLFNFFLTDTPWGYILKIPRGGI